MVGAADYLEALKRRILEEKRCGLARLEALWALPLAKRVRKCRAIGPLKVLNVQREGRRFLCHFEPSSDDMAAFRDGDRLRLSQDAPNGAAWIRAEFLGLTEMGLSVALTEPIGPELRGWTLDEDFFDLSGFYLAGLDELAATDHGRDWVLPVLMGEEIEQDYDDEAGEDGAASAEQAGANDSQAAAVAACVGAEIYHLVQGPPGTGKTQVLAMVVSEMVKQGKRVLVTAFTHRAIHHALRQISARVSCPVMKISDLIPQDRDGIVFAHDFAQTGLVGHPGPYVLGITPVSLATFRGKAADFDVAVIDEASQMRVEAAVLPMLRAKRWFFFGDHQQLPPVVQRPVIDPREDSVFAALAGRQHQTMLLETYRMNAELVRWPSENFYAGELRASRLTAGRRFGMEVAATDSLLDAQPAMVRREFDHKGCKSHSDVEVNATIGLIEEMLAGGITPADIGVVVPFRAQAARIRRCLSFERFSRFAGIPGLAVDTVERFQGQERKVMIVSFTASDPEFIEQLADFLIYPQRLNVAVTRARTKVILLHSRALRRWLEKRAGSADEQAALALSLLRAAVERQPEPFVQWRA